MSVRALFSRGDPWFTRSVALAAAIFVATALGGFGVRLTGRGPLRQSSVVAGCHGWVAFAETQVSWQWHWDECGGGDRR